MMTDYLLLGAIGFLAQIVDGALGMAFGVVSNAAMLTMGLPPAQASAIVHTAEVFTTAGSAASHIYHRNVDWRLVLRVGVAGVAGRGARCLGPVQRRCALGTAIHRRLSADHGCRHPPARQAAHPAARRAVPLGPAPGARRRLPRCQRRRRMGADRHVHAGRIGTRAAHQRRLGEHQRVLRHHRGRNHLLHRARHGVAWSGCGADHRRPARRAVRRMGRQARTGVRADDHGRLAGDRALAVAARARVRIGV